jgi:nitroreductase
MDIPDKLNLILSRRSIRKYTRSDVDDSQIELLLRAAMSAPSAGNEQPWHFIVIRNRGILDRIPSIHPFSLMLREAPAAILVCGDLACEKYKGYWVQDCSAAVENILLAANGLGLGAVWLGVYPVENRAEAFRELLGIPATVVPLALVPVGFPAEEKPPADRYDPSRIHRNLW